MVDEITSFFRAAQKKISQCRLLGRSHGGRFCEKGKKKLSLINSAGRALSIQNSFTSKTSVSCGKKKCFHAWSSFQEC